jgi:protein TonB
MPAAPDSISISPAAAVDPAAASAVAPLIGIAVMLPPALPTITSREITGLMAAIFAHVLVIAALLDRYDRIGSDGLKAEAIGVEIVTLAELSAALPKTPGVLRPTTTGTLAPRDGAIQAEQQSPSPDARAAVSEARPDAAAPADLVFPDAKRQPDPPEPDSTTPVVAPERSTGRAVEPVPELRKTVPSPQLSLDDAIPAEALLAAPQGGAPSAPQPTQRLAAVEADAAAGRRDAYGQAVFDTLRANPPAIVPEASGRVTIEFTIGRDGAPTGARVIASSGDRRMDSAAIAAVRGARFPRPPPGLDGRDLIYTMPFTFRWNAARK